MSNAEVEKKKEKPNPNEWRLIFENVGFNYGGKNVVFKAFKFSFFPNKMGALKYVLMGSSGSGKSTFINMILGNIIPQTGRIWFNGKELQYDDESFLRKHRASIGLVSQKLTGTLSFLTILENVKRPAILRGDREATEQAKQALESVGLCENLWKKYPHELSGGELQRALIAQVIVKRPLLLLCDEPTSALDGPNSRLVVDAIIKANVPTLVVTHNPGLFGPHMDGGVGLLADKGIFDISCLKNDPLLGAYSSVGDLMDARNRIVHPERYEDQKNEPEAACVESKTTVAKTSKTPKTNRKKHG